MAILIFQHSDQGGPARMGATLRDHALPTRLLRPDRDPRGVPSNLDDVHGLVVLGGPQNVTDIDRHPWMKAEADLIRLAHAAELPIVGICLGHQLVAHALGGAVAPRANPEVGFHTLSIGVPGQTETLLAGVPWRSPQFFSCSQEVTQLPPGAVTLAGTAQSRHAVFRVGMRTLGFQPHFELDRAGIERMVDSNIEYFSRAALTRGELAAQLDQHYASFARVSDRLCVNLVSYAFALQHARR